MINFWTCMWLVPHRSGTRRDGRVAGPDLGEFSSQAGGKEVLGNSVGKGRGLLQSPRDASSLGVVRK